MDFDSQINNDDIVASSSIWVAVTLNIIPGLGTGYIYQRRWKAYWATGIATVVLFLYIMLRQIGIDPADPAPFQSDQISLYGLVLISLITAFESALAVNRARNLRRVEKD
tara:strand:+ start:82 stop:411 length:330 start_codon:yes stop_codon:yes gene_type:complete